MQPTLFRVLLAGVLLGFLTRTSSSKSFYGRVPNGTNNVKPKLECLGLPADIVFVLDSSSSIWGPHFQKQLRFVTFMVDKLDIGMDPEQVRIGVEIFSSSAHVKIDLYESVDKETLKSKISRISRLLGNTNTADALNQLKETMFKPEKGSRPGVKQLAIILTDGASTDKEATQVAAKACRDSNIQLFAIGIGHSINFSELRGIASEPKDKFVFHAPSYRTLDQIRDKVVHQTCHTIVTYRSTTTPMPSVRPSTDQLITAEESERACRNERADIFFLLDSSSSILIDEFSKENHIIEDIINKFDINCTKTRVAVSIFNHKFISVLKFDSGEDKVESLKKIRNIKWTGRATKTGNALNYIRYVFNHASRRPRVERILIIFTDGMSIDHEQTSAEAKLLRNSGVKIFVVGIGPKVDKNKLLDIASQPPREFVYTFDTYDILLSKSGLLTYKVCTVNRENLNVCDVARSTDLVFMVSKNRLGQEKTNQILNASAEVIKVVGSNNAFSYGIIFDDCLPTKNFVIGSITDKFQLIKDIVDSKYSSLSSLLGKLQLNIFPRRFWDARQVGLLFLDNTIDLNDPGIISQIRRTHYENIQLYVVVIGDGIDISRVQNVLVPKERIIILYSYGTLPSYLPFLLEKRLCSPRWAHIENKPSLQ